MGDEEHTPPKSLSDLMADPSFIREKRIIQDKPRQPQVVGKCVHCSGNIVEEIETNPPPRVFEARIGAPGRPWITSVVGLYCENCGLMYHHPPREKE